MAVEMLKQIGDAEAKADQIRRQAADEAKTLIDEAQSKARSVVAESDAKAKTETDRLLGEAETEAAQQAKVYLQEIAVQSESIKEGARVNLSEAVEIILAKVVRASG